MLNIVNRKLDTFFLIGIYFCWLFSDTETSPNKIIFVPSECILRMVSKNQMPNF